jgi:Right handed beta helix region
MASQWRIARLRLAVAVAGTAAVALAGCSGGGSATTAEQSAPAPQPSSTASSGPITAAPKTPPAEVCGSNAILNGPATAPAGAVTVPAGDNGSLTLNQPGTTYWFAPGLHTLGGGEFENIDPGNNDTYIGGPGAVLDGENTNNSAFDDTSAHVKIEYLTIKDFGTWGGDSQEGVVNHDSGSYWTVSHSTVSGNAGAGVFLGSHDTLTWDCLQDNQQYGFSAYSNSGEVTDLTIDHNEIAGNDTYNYEVKQPGCGCSGGGKFWNVVNATVTNNWIYDNNSVGLWADTDNAGFEFEGNYFQDGESVALQYEISYNAVIEYNTFDHNGVKGGPSSTGFPLSAVYISESGADSRVDSDYSKSPFLIAHNIFTDNWGGVILWENSNRFCASPDNTSTSNCTMVNPAATLKSCGDASTIKTEPYLSDCRWKTQDVLVQDNQFTFSPSALGKACTLADNCGYNGVFSEYGSSPSWSPYQGDIVPTNITFHQGNKFSDNAYSGPWCFMGWQLGTLVNFKQWTAAASVSKKQFGQDAGSTDSGTSRSCA